MEMFKKGERVSREELKSRFRKADSAIPGSGGSRRFFEKERKDLADLFGGQHGERIDYARRVEEMERKFKEGKNPITGERLKPEDKRAAEDKIKYLKNLIKK